MANIERIPANKDQVVKKRLREVREKEGWGFRKTRTKVLAVLKQVDPEAKLHPPDVKRFEGSDERKTRPPVWYVEAFAEAAGVPVSYLMADDISPWSIKEFETVFREIQRDYRSRLAHPTSTNEERTREELRDKVAKTLLLASGIPLPRQKNPLGRHRDDVLAEIYADMQVLYWEAFWGREFTEHEQFLDAAMQLGRLIPSPAKLPEQGFLPLEEVSEDRLRRWWVLQAEALRVLLRPGEFEKEKMNLGRGGELGPLSWAELMKNRSKLAIPWDDENAIRAAASPAKSEEEQEEEAARAKRVTQKTRKREEVARIKSPEDRKRAMDEAYHEGALEKRERWAREQDQIPGDSAMSTAEPIEETDESGEGGEDA